MGVDVSAMVILMTPVAIFIVLRIIFDIKQQIQLKIIVKNRISILCIEAACTIAYIICLYSAYPLVSLSLYIFAIVLTSVTMYGGNKKLSDWLSINFLVSPILAIIWLQISSLQFWGIRAFFIPWIIVVQNFIFQFIIWLFCKMKNR